MNGLRHAALMGGGGAQTEVASAIILDNATFHKGGQILQLIEDAGGKVLYLPPYSPDFNKIERCWSWLKSRIRKQLSKAENLRDAMETVLREASYSKVFKDVK